MASRPPPEAAERGSGAFMPQLLLSVPTVSSFTNYFRDLLHWPPRSTSDAGELILVAATLAISMGIMVIIGQWWER
jgi:hypothetical protein